MPHPAGADATLSTFVAEGVQADAEFREQHEIDSVIATLEEQGYRSVLRSMLAAACDIVSVPKTAIRVDLLTERRGLYRRPELRAGLPGDLLFKDDLAFVLQPMGHRLHIWQIRHHGNPSGLECLCSTLESAVKSRLDGRRIRGMNFSWKPIKERSRRYLPPGRFYQEAKLEIKLAEYTQEESVAAKLFVSPDVRSFMIRLAQVGKARAADAVSDAGKLSIDDLLTLQLIRKEYLVLCRKDSHTICAIQDPREIEGGSASLFSCPVCGRPFRDELIQDIYALTESGKKLLSGSRWRLYGLQICW
jgi:hypothetical protein